MSLEQGTFRRPHKTSERAEWRLTNYAFMKLL